MLCGARQKSPRERGPPPAPPLGWPSGRPRTISAKDDRQWVPSLARPLPAQSPPQSPGTQNPVQSQHPVPSNGIFEAPAQPPSTSPPPRPETKATAQAKPRSEVNG